MKFVKVMSLHMSVCPQGEVPGQVPLRAGTPPGRYIPPGSSACWEIWATSGRYTSYWNAFLLSIILQNAVIDKRHILNSDFKHLLLFCVR